MGGEVADVKLSGCEWDVPCCTALHCTALGPVKKHWPLKSSCW